MAIYIKTVYVTFLK